MRLAPVICAVAVCGCATVQPAPQYATQQTFQAPYDRVWQATIAALEDHPVMAIEKDSGFITTDWVTTMSAGHVAGGLGMLPGGQAKIRYKLNLHVTRRSDAETDVRVTNHSEAWVYNFWSSTYDWQPIASETVVEHALLEKIQEKTATLP